MKRRRKQAKPRIDSSIDLMDLKDIVDQTEGLLDLPAPTKPVTLQDILDGKAKDPGGPRRRIRKAEKAARDLEEQASAALARGAGT